MKKYSDFFLFLSIILTGLSLVVANPVIAQDIPEPDVPTNIALRPMQAIDTALNKANSAINKSDAWVKKVLNPLAIEIAVSVSQKLSTKTQQWISGGFQNTKQLFIDDWRSYLKEPVDAAIRVGLTQLNSFAGESVTELFGTALQYDPTGRGQIALDVSTEENLRAQVPSYILSYLKTTYNARDDKQLAEKMIRGAGIKEISNYCDSDITSCPTSDSFMKMDPSKYANCLSSFNEYECKLAATQWEITFGMKTGEALTFRVTGFDKTLVRPFEGVPVDNNGGRLLGDFTLGDPILGRQSLTLSCNLQDTSDCSGMLRPTVSQFERKRSNAFSQAITRSVVRSYHAATAGKIETTLREQLGPEWVNFVNDATVGYDNLNPYAAFDAILNPGNNPLGTAYVVANDIALMADKRLKAATTRISVPGVLPDEECEKISEVLYEDGNSEEFCSKISVKSPGNVVGTAISENIRKKLAVDQEITEWVQIPRLFLADMAGAVFNGGITLGLNKAQEGIQSLSQTVDSQLKGLGPFEWLFQTIKNGNTGGNPDAWQLLAGREVDLTDIDNQINLTLREGALINQIAIQTEQLGPLVMVLDQECVIGPDFNWEDRLSANFSEDSKRLRDKVAKSEARDTSDGPKVRARELFYQHLQEEYAEQVQWVKDAMPNAPFIYQQQNMALVDDIVQKLESSAISAQNATDKRTIASTLSNIKAIVKDVPLADVLVEKAPNWEPDPEPTINALLEISLTPGMNQAQQTSGSSGGGNTLYFDQTINDPNLPDGTTAEPVIIINKTYVTLPATDDEFLFDVMTGVYGDDPNAANPANRNITDDITVSIDKTVYTDPTTTQTTTITGTTTIDLSEIVDASLPNDAPLLRGAEYRVSYSVTDPEGLIGTATRIIRTKTYDQHLEEVDAFNKRFNAFIEGLQDNSQRVRAALSRAVNLYLGIEDEISSERSVRDAQSELEKLGQDITNIEDQLDACWLEFYRLDKLIDEDDFPDVGTVALLGGGLNTADLNQYLKTRANPKIPYVSRPLPINNERGDVQPVKEDRLGFVEDLVPLYGRIVDLFSKNTDPSFGDFLAREAVPDFKYIEVPDFQCQLDVETKINLDDECSQDQDCIDETLSIYEAYHCISRAIPANDRNYLNATRRKFGGNDKDVLTRAYVPGREQIGRYEPFYSGLGVYDVYRDPNVAPRGIVDVFVDADGDGQDDDDGRIDASDIFFTPPNSCPTPSRDLLDKAAILGSPINNCGYYWGTLIHSDPPLGQGFVETGLGYGQARVLPFVDAWKKNLYNFPVEFNGWYPNANADPRYFISGTMHSHILYSAHTQGTAYCNPNSPLMNPLWTYTEKLGVTEEGLKNEWWNGEFNSDGVPETSPIGNQNWQEVQRCDYWTKSDLSTYTEWPKVKER